MSIELMRSHYGFSRAPFGKDIPPQALHGHRGHAEATANSQRCFRRMRAAIEAGEVGAPRALDACTQAVVWHLKRQEIPADDFRWFAARARGLVRDAEGEIGDGQKSAWYRAVAMVPARVKRADTTRALMERARTTAERAERSGAMHDRHLVKTYYESSIKEFMHVTRDPERALASTLALIDVDPTWSVSWGERAETLAFFGQREEAAAAYDRAVRLGPPYVRHHLMNAAELYRELGDERRAGNRYYAPTLFQDAGAVIVERALAWAEPAARSQMAAALEQKATLDGS